MRVGQAFDLVQTGSRGLVAIAEFVDVFHAAAPLLAGGAAIVGEQRVHEIPQDVIGDDVAFLDAVDRRRRHDQAMIDDAAGLHPAAVAAGQPDGHQAHLLGLGEGGDQIGRIAAGGDADQAVARPRLGDDLADEDVLEADVVADRRDHREIGDEVDRGQRRAAGRDRMQELDRDMRGVAARAAIAHGEQPAAAAVDVGERLRRGDQDRSLRGEEARVGLARVARLVLDRMQQRRVELGRRPAARRAGTDRAPCRSASLDMARPSYSAAGVAHRVELACASPSSVRICSVSAASASSIRLMAKPTCTSTQSPTQASTGCSSSTMQAMLTWRLTPRRRRWRASCRVVDLDDAAGNAETHGCSFGTIHD